MVPHAQLLLYQCGPEATGVMATWQWAFIGGHWGSWALVTVNRMLSSAQRAGSPALCPGLLGCVPSLCISVCFSLRGCLCGCERVTLSAELILFMVC